MNFQQLRIVRETIRHKFNLTDAANALFTSQSGVSKHIRDLEQELGVEIFVRRGKRLLGLTEPGKEVSELANRMLVDADNLSRIAENFAKGDEGTLTIATTHTQARYTLPSVIAEFKRAFPNVRLSLQQANPKDLPAILLDGATDIAIATDTLEDHPGILAFPYHTWDHAIVVPTGHPLSAKPSVTLAELTEWPIITYDDGLTGRIRIDKAFEAAGLTPDIAITALDADVIKAYAALGMGVGIIASVAYDEDQDRKLVRLPAPGAFTASTSSIAIRRGRVLRRYAYRFIEQCSPELTEAVVRNAAESSFD
ncbi:CysB family HTH-type transcriptional regulator [Hyphomicrobium sp.]|jgi:LysR family cys regulon transcriptional activator|uniref:CysB family HTH-type transcriptional regulator n=1 Tax=Hyphomicrobium sp. TaxID=82 RepID=UPI002BD17C63|nr:CysB family HTH-type transcriptional regulator [Hyphomicrobium sp.]HVZ03967.1 CysB family HTH-type transcriptional regulator [Hyphomicrobium sp.]